MTAGRTSDVFQEWIMFKVQSVVFALLNKSRAWFNSCMLSNRHTAVLFMHIKYKTEQTPYDRFSFSRFSMLFYINGRGSIDVTQDQQQCLYNFTFTLFLKPKSYYNAEALYNA